MLLSNNFHQTSYSKETKVKLPSSNDQKQFLINLYLIPQMTKFVIFN